LGSCFSAFLEHHTLWAKIVFFLIYKLTPKKKKKRKEEMFLGEVEA
jgi:hypothetical protein